MGAIIFLINHTNTHDSPVSSFGENPKPPGKYFNVAYFSVCIFLFNPDSRVLFPALTISDRGILSLLDVFTSPLDLILTVN